MESGVTLADIRKEETLQRNCTKVGIVYRPSGPPGSAVDWRASQAPPSI